MSVLCNISKDFINNDITIISCILVARHVCICFQWCGALLNHRDNYTFTVNMFNFCTVRLTVASYRDVHISEKIPFK